MNYILDGNVTVNASVITTTISAPQIILRGATTGGTGVANVTAGSPITFTVVCGSAATRSTDFLGLAGRDRRIGGDRDGPDQKRRGHWRRSPEPSTYTGGAVIKQGTLAVSGLAGAGSGQRRSGRGPVTISDGTVLALQGADGDRARTDGEFLTRNNVPQVGAGRSQLRQPNLYRAFRGDDAGAGRGEYHHGRQDQPGLQQRRIRTHRTFTANATNPTDTTVRSYGFTVTNEYEVTFGGYIAVTAWHLHLCHDER